MTQRAKLELHSRGWRDALANLLVGARKNLTIVSPYIRRKEAEFVATRLRRDSDITALTCLDASAILRCVLEIDALRVLDDFSENSKVMHLRGLHAKVYIADKSEAIIISANLTTAGIDENYEYGIGVRDSAVVRRICSDIAELENRSCLVSAADLNALAAKFKAVNQSRMPGEEELESVISAMERKSYMREDDGGGAKMLAYKRAVFGALQSGPKTTREIYADLRQRHPELIIETPPPDYNGKELWWQHQVREAQDALKKRGKIVFDKGGKKWKSPPGLI